MILGVMEFEDKQLTDASLQLITFASEIASSSGDEFVALVIGGKDCAGLADQLGTCGVSQAIIAADERLENYAPTAWAKVVSQVIADKKPNIVIAAGTDKGNEFMTHVAAMSGQAMASNCTAVTGGEPFRITRSRWAMSAKYFFYFLPIFTMI